MYLKSNAVAAIRGSDGEGIDITASDTALQLESGSHWSSSGVLTIKTKGERIVQLNAAHFDHQGSLNRDQALTIQGNQITGLRNVLAITDASTANLKVDHSLTLNHILLAKQAGASVTLESPQLNVTGVIDLSESSDITLTLNGSGTLHLDTLKCSSGSRLNINGNYQVSIGRVIFDLNNATTAPAWLAFHLSPKNQLKIGQFILPKSSPTAPIIEITGSDLAVEFDLKNVDGSAFPAGRHSDYQADDQSPPIRLISDASGSLITPSTARLTPLQATGELPVTTTLHQLTQALAAEESSEAPGIRQRQLYFSAVGQAAPIALLTNASSLLIPTNSQLSSYPPSTE